MILNLLNLLYPSNPNLTHPIPDAGHAVPLNFQSNTIVASSASAPFIINQSSLHVQSPQWTSQCPLLLLLFKSFDSFIMIHSH